MSLDEAIEQHIAGAPSGTPHIRSALRALREQVGGRPLVELTAEELRALRADLARRLPNAAARRESWSRVTTFLRAQHALGRVSAAVAIETGIHPLRAVLDGERLRAFVRLRAADD